MPLALLLELSAEVLLAAGVSDAQKGRDKLNSNLVNDDDNVMLVLRGSFNTQPWV